MAKLWQIEDQIKMLVRLLEGQPAIDSLTNKHNHKHYLIKVKIAQLKKQADKLRVEEDKQNWLGQ